MRSFPPPPPFRVETSVEATEWLDPLLYTPGQFPPLVGEIVPSGFDVNVRLLHPARRFFGPSAEQSVPLRWSEIAEARGKTMHPEVQLQALIDNWDEFDYEHWKMISTGGGEWFPPYEWLEESEALALVSLLRSRLSNGPDTCFLNIVGQHRTPWLMSRWRVSHHRIVEGGKAIRISSNRPAGCSIPKTRRA